MEALIKPSGQQLYLDFLPTLLHTLTIYLPVNNLNMELHRRHQFMLRRSACLPMQPYGQPFHLRILSLAMPTTPTTATQMLLIKATQTW